MFLLQRDQRTCACQRARLLTASRHQEQSGDHLEGANCPLPIVARFVVDDVVEQRVIRQRRGKEPAVYMVQKNQACQGMETPLSTPMLVTLQCTGWHAAAGGMCG